MIRFKEKNVGQFAVIVTVIVLLSAGAWTQAWGEEEAPDIPACEFKALTLRIPADLQGHTKDPDNVVGEHFEYGVTGCVFDPLSDGEIPLRDDANTLGDDTVFKVLAKLRKAYDDGNIGRVTSLYTTQSAPRMQQMLANEQVKQNFLETIGRIETMYAGLAFEWNLAGTGKVIIVMMIQELEDLDPRTVSPVIFQDVSGEDEPAKFRAVAGGSPAPIFANLAVFLKNEDSGALLPE